MRPLGVTLAACYEFLRAILFAVFAAGVAFVGGVAAHLAGLAAEGNLLQHLLAGFGKFVGLALLVFAGIHLVLGVGLLLRQNWARLLTIFFSGLSVLVHLPRFFHFGHGAGLSVLLNLAVLIYLLFPEAGRYFGQKESVTPNAA